MKATVAKETFRAALGAARTGPGNSIALTPPLIAAARDFLRLCPAVVAPGSVRVTGVALPAMQTVAGPPLATDDQLRAAALSIVRQAPDGATKGR